MRIKWYGHACFLLDWGEVQVLTDPFDQTVGYPLPSEQVDFITVSHEHYDHNHTAGVPGEPTVFRGPGEQTHAELSKIGLRVTGFPSFHDPEQGTLRGANTIFRFTHHNLVVVHLGDLGEDLSESLVEEIGSVDILLVPVGGTYTLDAQGAYEVVQTLRPKVVIPMHYHTPVLKFELAKVTEFTRLFPQAEEVSGSEITIVGSELVASNEPKIIRLNYQ